VQRPETRFLQRSLLSMTCLAMAIPCLPVPPLPSSTCPPAQAPTTMHTTRDCPPGGPLQRGPTGSDLLEVALQAGDLLLPRGGRPALFLQLPLRRLEPLAQPHELLLHLHILRVLRRGKTACHLACFTIRLAEYIGGLATRRLSRIVPRKRRPHGSMRTLFLCQGCLHGLTADSTASSTALR